MNYLVVIPARYASSRLPAKPLVDIAGTPMIIRTYRQCLQAADAEKIIIATDDLRIRDLCEAEGARVLMTSPDCLTGTDRVAEVAAMTDAECYINVQGDEPLFPPQDIRDLISAAQRDPESIINGYCTISEEAQFRSRSIPKCVVSPDGKLLYMSRSPIPAGKEDRFTVAHRQVCAYAFPREKLKAFAQHGRKTPLEHAEDIEILRFLELGYSVRMIPMSDESIAVDLPEDVARVEAALAARGEA